MHFGWGEERLIGASATRSAVNSSACVRARRGYAERAHACLSLTSLSPLDEIETRWASVGLANRKFAYLHQTAHYFQFPLCFARMREFVFIIWLLYIFINLFSRQTDWDLSFGQDNNGLGENRYFELNRWQIIQTAANQPQIKEAPEDIFSTHISLKRSADELKPSLTLSINLQSL